MSTKDHIVFQNGHVHRPAGIWTKNVHKLLYYLREQNFDAAPLPIGFDGLGNEVVTYVQGSTGEFPFDENLKSEAALISSARLLRALHDASVNFLKQNIDHQLWQLAPKALYEVMCHGDFAPYNVVYENQKVTGIIDFDCAHPGPRIWELAYALYRWAPLTNPHNPDGFGTTKEQIKRAKLFIDTYGLDEKSRKNLVELITLRLEALIKFMFTQAEKNNQIYQLCIANNHHLQYQADINYIKANRPMIQQGLYD